MEEELHNKDIQHLGEKLEAVHEDVKEIKAQVIRVNGRVSKLEMWRSFILGGVAVTVVFFALFKAVIPLI